MEFCDNEGNAPVRHNRDAPTQQNIQCFGKSVWEASLTIYFIQLIKIYIILPLATAAGECF